MELWMLGWYANVVIIIGMILVGHKNRLCFVFSIAGEALWSVYAAYLGMWDLMFVCVVFCFVAARNYRMWGAPDPDFRRAQELLKKAQRIDELSDLEYGLYEELNKRVNGVKN